jgi:hypothetical protein
MDLPACELSIVRCPLSILPVPRLRGTGRMDNGQRTTHISQPGECIPKRYRVISMQSP